MSASANRRRLPEWAGILLGAARTPRGAVGLALAGAVIAFALIGPFVTPYSPTKLVGMPFAPPLGEMLLGGDSLGRDVLSRLLGGGARLLLMAALSTTLGVLVGTIVGVSAAYFQGAYDNVVMRVNDVLMAFPNLVLAILLVSIVGPEPWLVVCAIALAQFPHVARVMRSAALDLAERDFVRAAEVLGISRISIIKDDLLPNLVSPLMVEVGLRFTYGIMFIAALSFIGLGAPPPTPDWGIMINENRLGLTVNPLAVIAPAVLIALLTVGVNTFTDAVARRSLRVDGAARTEAAPGEEAAR